MRKEALLETSTSAISRPQRERKVAAESVIGVNFYKLCGEVIVSAWWLCGERKALRP